MKVWHTLKIKQNGVLKHFCDLQGWKFKILTEDDLGKY